MASNEESKAALVAWSDRTKLKPKVEALLVAFQGDGGEKAPYVEEYFGGYKIDVGSGLFTVTRPGLAGFLVSWEQDGKETLTWREVGWGKPAQLLAAAGRARRELDRQLMIETLKLEPFNQSQPEVGVEGELLRALIGGLREAFQRKDLGARPRFTVTETGVRFELGFGYADLQRYRLGTGGVLTWEPGRGATGRSYREKDRTELFRLYQDAFNTRMEMADALADSRGSTSRAEDKAKEI